MIFEQILSSDFNSKPEDFPDIWRATFALKCKGNPPELPGLVEDRLMTTIRRTGATSAATLCGLALTVLLANAIAPGWVQSSGLDVWNLPSAISANKSADLECVSLREQEQKLIQEIQFGNSIADELAAGTITLKEAIDELEPVMRNRNGFVATLQINYCTTSLREGVARYLLSHIHRLMEQNRDQLSDTLSRLECEWYSLNGG